MFSESERESGATSSCVETSDLSINDPENVSADTTDEESRFLLAKDLRGPSGSGIFETAPSTPTTSGFVSPSHINEDMDLTSQQHNMSNKENTENMEESTSVLSVSRSKNRRTPLGEMDLEGERVTYNPKTETGTVANLREAQILLRNVGMQGKRSSGGVTPYRLSDCYVALSPGRCMSLDQLLNLGLMAGQAEDVGPSSGGGRKRRLNGLSEGSKPTTSSPQLSSAKRAKSTSLHGLRDIPKNNAIENASEEETNDEPVPSELQTREELSDNDKPNTELEDVEVLRRLFEESAPQENTTENSGEVESVHEGMAVVDERVESASDAVESDSRCNMVTIEKFSDIYDSPKANDAGSNEDFTTDPSEDTEVITKNIRNRINRASYIESPVIQKPEKCKKSGTRGKSINLGNTNMSTVEKSKGKHKGKNTKSTNSSITNTAMRDENDVSGSSEGLNIPKKSTIASTMKKKSSTAPMKTKDSMETISVETTPESQDKVRGGKNSLQLAPDTSQNDENAGRVKRCRAQISYALPSLNSKLRRDK